LFGVLLAVVVASATKGPLTKSFGEEPAKLISVGVVVAILLFTIFIVPPDFSLGSLNFSFADNLWVVVFIGVGVFVLVMVLKNARASGEGGGGVSLPMLLFISGLILFILGYLSLTYRWFP